MSFLKRYKIPVAIVGVLALVGGAAHFSGMTCCTGTCALTSLLSTSTAYAGPGCNSASKTSAGACDADSKTKVSTASATSADGKTCTKEDCIKGIMAEKKVSRDEAEVIYAKAVSSGSCHGETKATASLANASSTGCSSTKATAQLTGSASGCCASKASAQTASASGCSSEKASVQAASASGCAGHATTTASLASATEGKTCDKEACIAKCMAEKGYTRAQAEECWAKCAAGKSEATQATVMTASATSNTFTRDAWIDAKVASGLTRAEAEVAATKAAAAGEVTFVTAAQTVNASGCSATKASATGSSCCANKAKAATAEVKTEETKPAASTASATAPSGGNK